MKVICITGGIGSGKSMVAKVIATLAYPVYYSDERAKQMYFLPNVKKQIVKLLGHQSYLNEHEIDKKYIASKIFNDNTLLQPINSIIHTAVQNDFKEFITAHSDAPLIFKESAILFESHLQNNCDKIILVTAPKEIRVHRIKKRDNLNEKEILQRMEKQWGDEKKIPLAHFVINNIDTEPLLPKVIQILEELKKN